MAWAGSAEGVAPRGATLAELYALRGNVRPVRATELRSAAGVYLQGYAGKRFSYRFCA